MSAAAPLADTTKPEPSFVPFTRAACEAYLAELQRALRLRDWTIEIDWGRPADSGYLASVGMIPDRRVAKVWLGEGFEAKPREEQRGTLVHELLHCHLRDVEAAAEHARTVLGAPAGDLLSRVMRNQIELATDAIEAAVSPHLPLPPWGGA